MAYGQSAADSVEGAKGSARDSAEQAKRAARDGKEETKQWGRGVKDSAAESWDQTKQWGQDTSREVEHTLKANVGNPNKDVLIDFGHPLVNRVFDGFVKVGGVGAIHAASQDGYRFLTDDTNKKPLDISVQRVGKESVQWGLVAGVYSGVTYGIQEARGVHDWKNALLGGALTGAALSLTEANPGSDRVIRGALTGGAIATAAEVLRKIT